MTYYVKTPEMGLSIFSDGVDKLLSVRPAADDDLLYQNAWNWCIHFEGWGWISHYSMHPAADDDLVNNNLCRTLVASLQFPITSDERFKVTSIPI